MTSQLPGPFFPPFPLWWGSGQTMVCASPDRQVRPPQPGRARVLSPLPVLPVWRPARDGRVCNFDFGGKLANSGKFR